MISVMEASRGRLSPMMEKCNDYLGRLKMQCHPPRPFSLKPASSHPCEPRALIRDSSKHRSSILYSQVIAEGWRWGNPAAMTALSNSTQTISRLFMVMSLPIKKRDGQIKRNMVQRHAARRPLAFSQARYSTSVLLFFSALQS